MVRLGGQVRARPSQSADLPGRFRGSGMSRAYARRSLSGSDYSTMHRSSPLIRRGVSVFLVVAAICAAACLPAASVAAGPAQQQAPAQAPSAVNRASSTVEDASEPSMSSDGRWIVFQGRVADRQTVFRTD